MFGLKRASCVAMIYQVNVMSVRGKRTRWTLFEDLSARSSNGASLVPSKPFVFWLLLDLLRSMWETGGATSFGGRMYCPLDPDAAKARACSSPLLSVVQRPDLWPNDLDSDAFYRLLDFVCRNADEYIAGVEVRNRRYWNAEPYLQCDPWPRADYLIEATEARWLEFLVPGTRMGTADYPPEKDWQRWMQEQADKQAEPAAAPDPAN